MRLIAKGATSQTVYFSVNDSASTTGGKKTGIAFNAAGIVASYTRNGAARTAITLATQTASGAWSSGGWVEVDATNEPGLYRFDVPDAAFASGADSVVIQVRGASGMVDAVEEVQLTTVNLQDAVRAGLTALPNAAANAAGGLPVSIAGALDLDEMNVDIEAIQTSTAGLTYTVANQVDANVLDWKSAVAPAMTGDAFARLGAPAGASIAADLAEIEVETDTIGTDTAGVTTLLTRIPGTVQPQTGDSYARLGAPVGASISADIAEVEADVDLLGAAADPWATAVPGAYGAGTAGNILGNRLDVAVSTRATSAGAGGAGSRQVTITVDKPDTTTPLGSCAVWVSTDAAGTNVVAGTLYTNDSTGQVQFMLDNGSYYYWRQHPAYTFTNPVAITVS